MLIEFFLGTALTTVAVPLSYPLVPIAVAKADRATGRLQPRHRWLETPDAVGWGAGTYEPAIKKIYDERGKEAALRAWLWRNKAYGLRYKLRATINPDAMTLHETGTRIPPRLGPWAWRGTITSNGKTWFEARRGWSFGVGHVSVHSGWKLQPLFDGYRPKPGTITAVGLFEGVTVRLDDWDDYRGK